MPGMGIRCTVEFDIEEHVVIELFGASMGVGMWLWCGQSRATRCWYVLHSVLVFGIVGGRSMWLGESLAMVRPDTVRSGMVSARMRMAVKLRCDV